MATTDQITNAIERAQAYYVQLLDQDTAARAVGLLGKSMTRRKWLDRLLSALQWDLDIEVNDSVTEKNYQLLLDQLYGYNGGAVVYDPTVILPGRTVIIPPPAYEPITIQRTQASLIDAGGGNWYLPLIGDDGNNILGRAPVSVIFNGESFNFTFDNTFTPNRIYGFANNDAPQTIIVTII